MPAWMKAGTNLTMQADLTAPLLLPEAAGEYFFLTAVAHLTGTDSLTTTPTVPRSGLQDANPIHGEGCC